MCVCRWACAWLGFVVPQRKRTPETESKNMARERRERRRGLWKVCFYLELFHVCFYCFVLFVPSVLVVCPLLAVERWLFIRKVDKEGRTDGSIKRKHSGAQ